MRDPARIDRIIELLRKRWHASPDQRLGQLIANLHHGLESFAVEDDHTHLLLMSRRAESPSAASPYRDALPPVDTTPPECDHGVTFDAAAAGSLGVNEIRKRWPRLSGKCPKDCGYNGIAYASTQHYVWGDW